MAVTKTKTGTRYHEAVGRRKESVARVRITPGKKTDFRVNGRKLAEYFPTEELVRIVKNPLEISQATLAVEIVVRGGGVHSQAQAVAHGIARALIISEQSRRGVLKKAGLLKRDARIKERRKFGLKKARKAPQWSKR